MYKQIILAYLVVAVALFWYLCSYGFIYAADVQITGTGYAPASQCYIDQGGGEWHSEDGTIKLCTLDAGLGDDYAILTNIGDVCGSGLGEYYYHFGAPFTSSDLPATGGFWNAPSTWTAPGPVTITETTCGITPTPTTTPDTSSTSTPDQTQENLFNAFIIFFIAMLIPMWFFKRKS